MASLAENTARVMAVFDNMKTTFAQNGITVQDGTPVEEYPDKINDVYSVGYGEGYHDGGGGGTGYDEGYNAGKQAQYDEFWDSYQNNGNRVYYAYAFRGEGWNDITFNPKYKLKLSSGWSLFYGNFITDYEKVANYVDFSTCVDIDYAFFNTQFKRLLVLDFSSVTKASATFMNCSALTTIDKIIISSDGSFPFAANTFNACAKLTEIRFEGVIGKDFYIQHSNLLSKDSIINIFEALSSATEGLSASFSKKAVGNAFETGEGLADGTSSSEWAELIATKPNWTITLV